MKTFCSSVVEPLKMEPVMGEKVLEHIQPSEGAVVLDMTFGCGGHSELILKSDPTVKVLALDRDPASHSLAQSLAYKYPDRLVPLHGKFSDLPNLIEPLGYGKGSIDAMLFDCGCSDLQMMDISRGFSHEVDGPLDMRMDGKASDEGLTAYELLYSANEIDLKNIFKVYGMLSAGKKIARALLYLRHTHGEVRTTSDLVAVLDASCDLASHEVRSTFRALRYFVNDELNELSHGILLSEWYLKTGGRLLTISEDQVEDTIIKNHFTGTPSSNFAGLPMRFASFTAPIDGEFVKKTCWSKINKHVLIPEGDRLLSRSRKLRAVVKM